MPVFGRTTGKAVLSLVLGLLSVAGGLVLTGVPAIVLGLVGLREINESDGRLGGQKVAIAGMVLGAFGVVLCGVVVVVVGLVRPLWATSERTTCQANLMKLGQALDDYAGKDNPYPTGTWPNPKLAPDQRLSWCVAVLPGLREQARYDDINKQEAWDAPANTAAVNRPVRWFLCPAHPAEVPVPGPTYYVGMAGDGKDAAVLPLDDPRVGLFGYGRKVRRADITRGLSETIIVTETAADIGPWAEGGPPTVRGLDTSAGHAPFLGPGGQFGGLHLDVTMILFADGSARPEKDTMDPEVLERMVRIRKD